MDSARLLNRLTPLVCLATLSLGLLPPARADEGQCVDQEMIEKATLKRARRGAEPRDFVKAQRHEISIMGGYYVSDLFEGTYVLGLAYTYHPIEYVGLEASGWFTRTRADVLHADEDGRAVTIHDLDAPAEIAAVAAIWYPLHGKMQLGGGIAHFDFHLDAGVGVMDTSTSRGVAGIGGLGLKLYSGKAIGYRIDVRDHVYRQELLDSRFIVNDVSVTFGISLFLPTAW